MSYAIEYRSPHGRPASESCASAAQYQAAIQLLLAQHVEHGHVIEAVHGQIEVRDKAGEKKATYWFVE